MISVEIEIPPDIAEKWEERDGPIVKYPHPALYETARPVTKADGSMRELVDRMKCAMNQFSGVGLAAPQLGIPLRVIIWKLPLENEPLRVIVNPKILSRKGEQIGVEGCLSIPLLQGDVKRANEVIVKGMDILGRPFRRRATEFEARVIQHEVDHLDGILFIERAEPDTLHWIVEGEEHEEGV